MKETIRIGLVVLLASTSIGCGDDTPAMDGGADGEVDAGLCMPRPMDQRPDPGTCVPAGSDFAPCEQDMWDACVSDFGQYSRIEETISSIARVMAYERIAALLFDPMTTPTSDDFLMARLIYQEDEGLDSRVVRRYDPYFEVPAGTDCGTTGVPAMFPEYCAGPATIQPILLEAFMMGIAGDQPDRQAGRIDGALLWFLYISTSKEGLTCTTKAKDCDSAYAYYTGGEGARGGIGLARRISEVDAYAHDRAWDGALAVRCWRDLDPTETASDVALRDRARTQYDRALLDGVAAILGDHFDRLQTATGSEQAYLWGFLQTLGPVLDREATIRSAAAAQTLRDELAKVDPTTVDAAAARMAIDSMFDCP